ncbi:MAG: hypothetical protein C5S48_06850 [Candidatus Methanogaster sp.]|nr:MAG: hypothetical protein C5S48_06850 [ANME-2 cluster archaeon]
MSGCSGMISMFLLESSNTPHAPISSPKIIYLNYLYHQNMYYHTECLRPEGLEPELLWIGMHCGWI